MFRRGPAETGAEPGESGANGADEAKPPRWPFASDTCADEKADPKSAASFRKAFEIADNYLRRQYLIFGLWGLFNLMLMAIVVFLAIRLYRVVMQYYTLRRSMSMRLASNNVFDRRDDDEEAAPVAPDPKDRIPSGMAIINRLNRYSKESGTDLAEAIDPSKDAAPKPAFSEGDDEDD